MLFDDVKSSSADVTQYLWAWLDSYARGMDKQDRNDLSETEWHNCINELCAKLYNDLSIIDTKASGLISSNSILTGILSLISFYSSSEASGALVTEGLKIITFSLLCASFIALMLNVSATYLYWSTVTEISTRTDVDDRARNLIRIRNSRTIRFRISFLLHMFVIFSGLLVVFTAMLKLLLTG